VPPDASALARLRVAIDASPLIAERSGIGHTTARLLDGLSARADVAVSGYAVSRTGRDLLADALPNGVTPATSWAPARAVHTMWRRAPWPRLEHWTGPVDVVHATNFVAPPAHAPVVVTVHDLAFAHSPELCRPETLEYERLLRQAIDRGATVHVVSDFVGDEVRAHFGLSAERVVRVYFGVDVEAGSGDAARGRAHAGAARYVLAVGTVEPRKNYPRLVEAFDALAAGAPDLALVIAGGRGWGVEPLDDALARARHRDRVRVLGYVADDVRADLLAGATALAYPSLYEGFGHPPFEAMAAGVPVVAAAAGAIPEAVGDAALLVDPLDVDALSAALLQVCGDESLRHDLVARGHARAHEFPWPRAVDGLVALYRLVAAA